MPTYNKEKTKTVPVNWPLELHARIMAYAVDEKRSFANMVKLLCIEGIERLQAKEREEAADKLALKNLRKQQQQSAPQTPRYKPVQQIGREQYNDADHAPLEEKIPATKPIPVRKPQVPTMANPKLPPNENDKKLDAIRKKPKYGPVK